MSSRLGVSRLLSGTFSVFAPARQPREREIAGRRECRASIYIYILKGPRIRLPSANLRWLNAKPRRVRRCSAAGGLMRVYMYIYSPSVFQIDPHSPPQFLFLSSFYSSFARQSGGRASSKCGDVRPRHCSTDVCFEK